jgi:ClpP class serine protease
MIRAARNPKIRAVVLRVDSPGGDAIASSEIASMLGALKMLDKPVCLSLQD